MAAALWSIAAAAGVVMAAGPAVRTLAAKQGRDDAQPSVVTYSAWVRTDLTPPRLVVNMQVPVPRDLAALSIQMPVWSPGDYHVQNHGKYVTDFRAASLIDSKQGDELPVTHGDQSSWSVATHGVSEILVSYSVPQTPPGIFSDNVTLGSHYAFINGPSAFAYVADHKTWRTVLDLYLPAGWRAETALATANVRAGASAAFSAPDYDTLADSPIVAADPQGVSVRQFEVDQVPHRVVYFHRQMDAETMDSSLPALRSIVQAENDIMGGPPYARYDFLFDVGGGGGGLEHLNSARLNMFPGDDLRRSGSFVAHEFFHLWNVKRIRPAVLGPFDYIHPPRTRNLWFAEGVTEYYAHIAVRRAGLVTEADFLRHWRSTINRMQANPARKTVTADEASLRVWESGNSEGFGGLSYYSKGELIGLCLDLKIRHATANAKSLDDVMRLLLKRHNPPKPGYGEDEIRSTVTEIAGQDLSGFYDLLARSTDEMPFAECLRYAGLDTSLQPLPDATPAEIALRNSWDAGTTARDRAR